MSWAKKISLAGGLREPAHDVPAAGGVGSPSCPKFGTNAAQGTRYLREGFLDQCIEKYCELARMSRDELNTCKTPSLDEQNFTENERTGNVP